MEIEFAREINNSYMKIQSADKEDGFAMNMITQNKIDYLLTAGKRTVNEKVIYIYDVTSMIDLYTTLENREMDISGLKKLINALQHTIKEIKEFFLSPDGIILEPDKIFISSSNEIRFLYYNDEMMTFEKSVKNLFEYIIRKVNHKDNEAVTISYGIYKRICDGVYNIDTLFEYEEKVDAVCEIKESIETVDTIIPQTVEQEEEVIPKKYILLISVGAVILAVIFVVFLAAAIIPVIKIGSLGRMGCIVVCVITAGLAYAAYRYLEQKEISFTKIISHTEIIPFEKKNVRIIVPPKNHTEEDDNLTVVLNKNTEKREYCLCWDEKGIMKTYELNKNICIIGSSADRADCVINAEGISRSHARISKEDGRLYIKDLNSTNGTTVNGKELACFEICEIKPEDKIVIGKTVGICLTC